MKQFRRWGGRFVIVTMAIILAAMDTGVPVLAAPTKMDPYDTHKGDLYYYTQNGIIFYEGGLLRCGTGTAVSGGAAGILQAQTKLDKRFVAHILNEAQAFKVDPIAMASLLFWEHRGFPPYGQGEVPGESDSVGRGPWQITAGAWKSSYGDYRTKVYDPAISTKVAAELVKSWGGDAGSPIGSIDQDFSRGKNLPSMATVAKNYNAGFYTWRDPAVATYKQPGRAWLAPDRNWNNLPVGNQTKSDVIDDYILGMTYAYYLMATKSEQLGNVNTGEFVARALTNADKIKTFKFGGTDSGSNTANACGTASGNGNIKDTAFGLAWPNRKYNGQDRKSAARESYQQAMPQVQGEATANHINRGGRCDGCTAWTDCGVFVATTMRFSGADPDYQKRGTGLQLPYLRRNSTGPNPKYKLFEGLTDTSTLIPGDIFIVSGGNVGHTFIYVGPYTGDDGKKYDSLSASWGQRVPMAANSYFVQKGYRYVVARLLINNAAINNPVAGGTQP